MDIVTVLCEGTMKAAALHLHENEKFAELKADSRCNALMAGGIREILNQEMKPFIDVELKDCLESGMGEGWLRKSMNVQCNEWGLEALKVASEGI